MTYEIKCEVCRKGGKDVIYVGETGKSSYRRGRNHLDGWKRREDGNVLHEHCEEEHKDIMMKTDDFSMKMTGQYKTSLARQTSEGVLIDRTMKRSRENKILNKKPIELLNSRSQFHQPKLFKPRASNIQYDG